MNTITVKNLSTFTDIAALGRVSLMMSGDKYAATHNCDGKEVVKIIQKNNAYTVLNKDD